MRFSSSFSAHHHSTFEQFFSFYVIFFSYFLSEKKATDRASIMQQKMFVESLDNFLLC